MRKMNGGKMKEVIIAGILAMFLFISGCGDSTTGKTVASNEEVVEISLNSLSETAKFYTYDDNGVQISYFAVLGSDGEPRTAFDACDVCGGYKGYEQKGSDIRCRNCGRVFSIDGLGTKNKGYGCWPSYLPHEIEGDKLLIKVNDIKKGRSKFA